MKDETITITKSEYDKLVKRDRLLSRLEDAGAFRCKNFDLVFCKFIAEEELDEVLSNAK